MVGLLAAMMSLPTSAQQAAVQEPPTPSSDITVTAPVEHQMLEEQARAMVRLATAVTPAGQVARWNEPICLRVEGLEQPLADRVAGTINTIVLEVGARVGRGGCNANVFLLFTNDPASISAAIAGRGAAFFRSSSAIEAQRFVAGPGPLRWASRLSTRDARRGRLTASSAALMNSGDYNMGLDAPTTDSYDATLLRRPTRGSIDGMIVLVDGPAATGLSLDHVAEYAAVVILSQPQQAADYSELPSVLALGAYRPSDQAGPRYGAWDRAFLSALYAAAMDRSANASRSIVARRMQRNLGGN